jgi:hypothetical protein
MSAVSPLLFRLAAAEYSATAEGNTLTLKTDLPGGSLAARETIILPSTNGERRVLSPFILKGTTKARIIDVSVASAGNLIVYRIGFYLRRIGRTPSDWQWHWIPVVPTGDAWETLKVPVPPTPEEWAELKCRAVPPTPEEWAELKGPVPPTPEEWTTVPAIDKTTNEAHLHELPMDQAA